MRIGELSMALGVHTKVLDRWMRDGLISPVTGEGRHRFIEGLELRVAVLMAKLVSAGFAHDPAAEIARAMVQRGPKTIRTAPRQASDIYYARLTDEITLTLTVAKGIR